MGGPPSDSGEGRGGKCTAPSALVSPSGPSEEPADTPPRPWLPGLAPGEGGSEVGTTTGAPLVEAAPEPWDVRGPDLGEAAPEGRPECAAVDAAFPDGEEGREPAEWEPAEGRPPTLPGGEPPPKMAAISSALPLGALEAALDTAVARRWWWCASSAPGSASGSVRQDRPAVMAVEMDGVYTSCSRRPRGPICEGVAECRSCG